MIYQNRGLLMQGCQRTANGRGSFDGVAAVVMATSPCKIKAPLLSGNHGLGRLAIPRLRDHRFWQVI